ncbi:glucosaminidase domain-containing protein [Candidatus Pelagibacter bacterium]|nr:glucosaminidase domain-containing protein [Candidatus Pelagibacter bacterium]
MKKKLSYRDKLIELAYIYDVKEIKDYEKSRKSLTSGQLELILKKNKIIIPKDFKSNFLRDNFLKPVSKIKSNFIEFKENKIKDKNKALRRLENFKFDTNRKINRGFKDLWVQLGRIGLNFLNIIPKLGRVIYDFFGDVFTDVFHGIYNQQFDPKKAKKVIFAMSSVVIATTVAFSAVNYFTGSNMVKQPEIKKEVKKPEIKKEVKKPEIKKEVKKPEIKKEVKKPEIKKEVTKSKEKPKLEVKRKSVDEVILPNLNLKTETVLNLFKDVEYDLGTVRSKKLVKPIYFTQFPRDLDALESTKLKKETFIKIVLPLIVAENERIIADREKLINLSKKKFTTDLEKQWIRQKLLEYKVKKGDLEELLVRIDIIPTSIALAQAAKESGWGTSRFALEGNAIFGQWTWSGQGIAPLDRESNKNHKILKFPILRASVKAYQNNLNTHKSYSKFRQKRSFLREKNKKVAGLELTETLNNYAQTGSEYTKKLNQIIKQNRLTDFEPVRLVNSVKKIELSS